MNTPTQRVGVFVCGMLQDQSYRNSLPLPVVTSVSQTLVVAARGLGDPKLLVATLVGLVFVPILQAAVRALQYAAAANWQGATYPSGMGASLLIATTCYVAAGLAATWLEALLRPRHRTRWYAALTPRRSLLWFLPFLAGFAALPMTGVLGALPILRPAFLGDGLSIAATMIILGITGLLLFAWCLPIGRLSLLPLQSINVLATGHKIGWLATRGSTVRIASVLTLVLMVWTIGAAIVFAGFAAGRWPVGYMLFLAPDAYRLPDLVRTVFLETRQLYVAFPGAILVASCIAVVFRNLRGGVSTDLADTFD
jgi:hypothetical protein